MIIATYLIRAMLVVLLAFAGIEKLFLPYSKEEFSATKSNSDPIFVEYYDLLMTTGYLNYVGTFQLLVSLLLAFHRTYLLGAIMLVPLMVSIVMTHVFLSKDIAYLGMDIGFLLMNLFLIWPYRNHLKETLLYPKVPTP